jgi:hypothetical protein
MIESRAGDAYRKGTARKKNWQIYACQKNGLLELAQKKGKPLRAQHRV